MSVSTLRKRNHGAYGSPYSGVGEEFFPLGVAPDHSGVVLYESGYLPCNDWWNFPHVFSPFWRLYWNAQPGHAVFFGPHRIDLHPDEIMLIPDQQLFDCVGSQPVPTLFMAFGVSRRLATRQTIPVVLHPGPAEEALYTPLVALFADSKHHRERIFHTSLALLHTVLARQEFQWQPIAPAHFLAAVRYIDEHHATPLRVSELGRMAGLCPASFTKAFKHHIGQTPARYIMEVRTREVAALLANTEESLDDIAEQCGFPNRDYMSRVFRKLTGESPAKFRRRLNVEV
ncbi:MAG: helix-turn-helix transcriptional regulator [Lentisphaerae bacterium]|nr:helix-turn-helix transcriptional regulator [Lentisphaerota bacterium]